MNHAAAESPSANRNAFRYKLAIVAGLATLVSVVYGQCIAHDFVLVDDDVFITSNPVIQRGLTLEGLRYAFAIPGDLGTWHPLTVLSHQLDVTLFGADAPGGHHAMSAFLHFLASAAFFLALTKLTRNLFPSALVAALFAVHPLHVESVAWVAERKDVLAALMFGLVLLAYADYARAPRPRAYLAVTVLFGLGLMSKATLVTVPCVLLLLDFWPLDRFTRETWKRIVLEKVPWFVLSAMAIVLGVAAQQEKSALPGTEFMPLFVRVVNAMLAYGVYLFKTAWPVNLAYFYPHPYLVNARFLTETLAVWYVFAFVAGAGLFTALCIRERHGRAYLLVGWFWFLGMLVPMIGLVQIGGFGWADRATYLPHVGLFVAIVWAGKDLCARYRLHLRWTAGITALCLLILTSLSAVQARHWKDSESLFRHALAVTPSNPATQTNLGLALAEQGRNDEAIKHYQAALDLVPAFVPAHNNLGLILLDAGRTGEAISHFQRALAEDSEAPKTLNNLGYALAVQGNTAEAIEYFRAALRYDEEFYLARHNLGDALVQLGDQEGALAEFVRISEGAPKDVAAWTKRGAALLALGRPDQAVAPLRRAIQLAPDNAHAYFLLGTALEVEGQTTEARDAYRRVLQLDARHRGAALGLKRLEPGSTGPNTSTAIGVETRS